MKDKNQKIQNMIAEMAVNTAGITDEQVLALQEQLKDDPREVEEIKDILDNLSNNISKSAAGDKIEKVDNNNNISSNSDLENMFTSNETIENDLSNSKTSDKQKTLGVHPALQNDDSAYKGRRNNDSKNSGFITFATILLIIAFIGGLIGMYLFLK